MIDKLIKKNILRNKVGSFLIVFPIALVVMLFVSTFSIMDGVSEKVYERYEGKVYRTMVPVFINQTADKSFFNKVVRTKNVYFANPALLTEESFNNKDIFVKHVDLKTFRNFNHIIERPAVNIHTGQLFNKTDEVIIDEIFAKKNSLKVNDSVQINGKTFIISGLFAPWRGINPSFIIPDLDNEYNLVEVVVSYRNYDDLENLLTRYDYTATTVRGGAVSSYFKESAVLLEKSLSQILIVIATIILLSLINLMNITIYERRNEIKLLLNIGMKQNNIMWLIVLETVVLALAGFFAGTILGFLISNALMVIFGLISRSDIIWPVTSFATVGYAFIISVATGFLSSLYIAHKASRFKFNHKRKAR